MKVDCLPKKALGSEQNQPGRVSHKAPMALDYFRTYSLISKKESFITVVQMFSKLSFNIWSSILLQCGMLPHLL
jgi:hypothetical protein